MCGVIGYVGHRNAMDRLFSGLERLEYRGYDSAGICTLNGHGLESVKSVGKLDNLKAKAEDVQPEGTIGIGHTRWATHGKVTEANAHPFIAGDNDVAVVLNGIIENYVELREQLIEDGCVFTSETDAEVVAHLVERNYDGSLAKAVGRTYGELEGHFAFVAMHTDHPHEIVGTRYKCPLVVGVGKGETFVASSIIAFAGETETVLEIEDGELAIANGVPYVTTLDGEHIKRDLTMVPWDGEVAEKGGFDSFMLKEIHEQPEAIVQTLLKNDLSMSDLKGVNRIVIVACGTAYHAGLVGSYAIESWAKIPVECHVASEWQYRNPLIQEDTLVLGISQSGETADTLSSLRLARSMGAKTMAITNSPGSQITREVDEVLFTQGGIEIGVAATKTFISQATLMYMLAIHLAKINNTLDKAALDHLNSELRSLPGKVTSVLESLSDVEKIAEKYYQEDFFFYLGRHAGLPVALEGALKLKEITYIPTDAYAAGEMKHGPIAMLSEGTPTIAVMTDSHVMDKMLSNVQESRARGAEVIAIGTEGNELLEAVSGNIIYVPAAEPLMAAVLAVIPLQMLAYHIAVMRGLNVDMPRNLAKTVTVE